MEKINFRLTERKLEDQDIADFKSLINKELPIDFINHYKEYNGGWPNANRSEGEDLDYPFEHFFSIKFGKDTIEKKRMELKSNIEYDDMIPFAINDINNTFHISINIETYGKIYVYDNGIWEFHCNNFSDFLNGLNRDQFYGLIFDPKQLKWVEDTSIL